MRELRCLLRGVKKNIACQWSNSEGEDNKTEKKSPLNKKAGKESVDL